MVIKRRTAADGIKGEKGDTETQELVEDGSKIEPGQGEKGDAGEAGPPGPLVLLVNLVIKVK